MPSTECIDVRYKERLRRSLQVHELQDLVECGLDSTESVVRSGDVDHVSVP